MGSNSNITLGYSFLTVEADDDDQLDLRLAELQAALDAGASVIRLSASYDIQMEEAKIPGCSRLTKTKTPTRSPKTRRNAPTGSPANMATEAEFMSHLTEFGRGSAAV